MKISFIKSLGFAVLAGLAFASCDNDPCKDVVCGDNGVCVEGDCVCDAGYEGASCETLQATKFLGSYNAIENCSTSGTAAYTVGVFANADLTKFDIDNFWEFFAAPVVATISADGKSFTIADQEPDADGYRVEGTGSINDAGNIITLSYTVKKFEAGALVSTDECTNTTYTK
jgi:hypothetical protein